LAGAANAFSAADLGQGYVQFVSEKAAEGKCGADKKE
jgi:uncharacterized low-complexity protein